MRIRALIVGLALVMASSASVLAEERPVTPQPTKPQPAKPSAQPQPAKPSAQQQPARPSAQQQPIQVGVERALYLIRSTLLSLNDANRSGNYSVLRDLAAPDFQAKNSAADLALAFTDLRRRGFDLFAAATLPPKLTAVPAIDADHRLRLTGYFETQPLLIQFDLTFALVGNQWRLFGISLATPPAQQAPQVQQAPSPPAEPTPAR